MTWWNLVVNSCVHTWSGPGLVQLNSTFYSMLSWSQTNSGEVSLLWEHDPTPNLQSVVNLRPGEVEEECKRVRVKQEQKLLKPRPVQSTPVEHQSGQRDRHTVSTSWVTNRNLQRSYVWFVQILLVCCRRWGTWKQGAHSDTRSLISGLSTNLHPDDSAHFQKRGVAF